MGPVHNNFISWWQLHILIIGQPHKMLRDLRNSKRSRELSATLMKILVSSENHNVLNLLISLSMSECLAKLQDTGMSRFQSFCRPYILQRQPWPVGLSYHFLMQSSSHQYLHKSCTLSPLAFKHHSKISTALFLAEWPFKLVHVASLTSKRRTTAFWGNLSPI